MKITNKYLNKCFIKKANNSVCVIMKVKITDRTKIFAGIPMFKYVNEYKIIYVRVKIYTLST